MKTATWQICVGGKPAMARFSSWIDCIKIIAKLHRLGVVAAMRRVVK